MEERLTHGGNRNPLFSHDGIHDSQTHLASPSFFYEQLRRQIAVSQRTSISFSAIKITFTQRAVDSFPDSVTAEEILYFSCELRSLTRTEDCIGRLGVNECVVLLSDGELAAEKFISRLQSSAQLNLQGKLDICISMVTFMHNETGLELLERLDRAPLSTHST
jgi:GGDEF domain-containing protein